MELNLLNTVFLILSSSDLPFNIRQSMQDEFFSTFMGGARIRNKVPGTSRAPREQRQIMIIGAIWALDSSVIHTPHMAHLPDLDCRAKTGQRD